MTGGLTRVLSPDEVMGEVVWAEEFKQANNRRSEKLNVRKEINRTCVVRCFFNGDPSLRRVTSPPKH